MSLIGGRHPHVNETGGRYPHVNENINLLNGLEKPTPLENLKASLKNKQAMNKIDRTLKIN